jgi:hypothetical protein
MIVLLLFVALSMSQSPPTFFNESVTMGTSTFTIVKEVYARWPGWTDAMCPQKIRFINLHLNEITSVRAGRMFFKQEPCGGHIVFMTRPGGNVRNLDWTMATGERYSVDPNRVRLFVV